MKASARTSTTIAILAPVVALAMSACGGNHPADQTGSPVAASPAPIAAQPETAAPATEKPATPTAPPAAETQVARTPTKPSAKPSAQRTPPPPTPKPEPIVKTLAVGTDLDVELLDPASSKTSQVGNSLRARVVKPVVVDGLTVVPVGAVVHGTITEAIPLKKIGGAASLGIKFDALELDGKSSEIVAVIHEQGKSETGKDAGTIAGATAGGALLGRLLSKNDKTKGTLIGAVVGAAAGTGAAAATKGQEVELPAGTPLALHLEQPVAVTIQP